MFAKLFIVGTMLGICAVGIVASSGGFGRDVLESHVMDWTVGGLMVAGIAVTVGSYLIGKRRAAR